MTPETLTYPFTLDAAAIRQLLPHRDPIAAIHCATVLAHDHYTGTACWPASHPLLQGHFPGCPVVPGVMLLEAAAQLAGAGLLAGDPVARALGPDHLGMLTAIRKCFFKTPVLPEQTVTYDVHCRRMADTAVIVTASAQVAGKEVANMEFMVAHVPHGQLQAYFTTDQLGQLVTAPA